MVTLYDLPESRQRNFLWRLASRSRSVTNLGFDPRATTFGSEVRASLVNDMWIDLGIRPCRIITPDSLVWRHFASDDPTRPFGPTMGDLLDGAPFPESRWCAELSAGRWSARPAAQAAFAVQGRLSGELTDMESARTERWHKLAEEPQQRGEAPWNPRAAKPRRETDWHWADADGRILCCDYVEPVEGAVDLLSVPNGERCPNSTHEWPPSLISWHFEKRNQQLLTVRRALIDETGPRCAVCRRCWATVIDHDHLTGLVRGYICTSCNNNVDHCTHASGCMFAEYLNDPPATQLALEHPNHKAFQRRRGHFHDGRVEHFNRLVAEVADHRPGAHRR